MVSAKKHQCVDVFPEIPKNKQEVELLIAEFFDTLCKVSAYINVCIQACDQNQVGFYGLTEVLKDILIFMDYLLELYDSMAYLMRKNFIVGV